MRIATLALVLTVLAAGCAEQGTDPTPTPSTLPAGQTNCEAAALPGPDAAWKPEKPRVRIATSKGAFVVELETERAPITAGNFLNLSRAGLYNGTLFHRVVHDFVIQAGDPLSKDNDPSNDGTGGNIVNGQEVNIPDEFNPQLRHDRIGVLSMANSGPNSGSSQFFVTLDATPHLDDRHAVFAKVVEGIDIVRSIGTTQVDSNDRPLTDVRIDGIEELAPSTYESQRGAKVHVTIGEKRTEPGHPVRYAVVVQNTGNVRDRLVVSAAPPEGWTCVLDQPVVVNAGTGRVVFLSLTPPASASGTTEIPVKVTTSGDATAQTKLKVTIADLGAKIKDGDRVTGNYAGLLLDGRLFDTSFAAVAKDAEQPKFDTVGGFQDRGAYQPFPFTVGSGVIAGFTNLAKTASVGETVTGFIPSKDAYATGNQYQAPLTGRDLVFELEIVKVG